MLRPASWNFLAGAKPLPSFMLLRGLRATLTLFSFRILISSSVALTRWAAMVGKSNSPESATNLTGVMPLLFDAIVSISASLSEIWIVAMRPFSWPIFLISFKRLSGQEYGACGPKANRNLSQSLFNFASVINSLILRQASWSEASPTRPRLRIARMPLSRTAPDAAASGPVFLPLMLLLICISTKQVVPVLIISMMARSEVQ